MQRSIPVKAGIKGYQDLSAPETPFEALSFHAIVTRVRPRTSKGMTDLLLTHFKNLIGSDTSKKHLKWLLASLPKQASRAATPIRNVGVSLVIGIDQTNQSTNYERPCTTTYIIE